MTIREKLWTFALAILLASNVSAQRVAPDANKATTRPNILLLIGDDMGSETLSCYEWSKNPANTPTLNKLCKQGVRFDNFWTQPICTPTRATMLTGRYAFRTGVGRPTANRDALGYFPDPPPKPESAPMEPSRGAGGRPRRPANALTDWGLPLNEFAIPMAFKVNRDLGYSTAAIGKWHVADRRNGWERHPNLIGFDHFSGLIRGFPDSFFTWNKVVNGQWSGETGYTPDDKTDDAIAWIQAQGEKPWFLWMAYNLVHTPLHLPPRDRLRSDWSHIDPGADPTEDPLTYLNMMLEALDVEIERLLSSMPQNIRDNTYVIFMGDNGTDRRAVRPPIKPTKAKGSLYQGGINVPLFVSGPGVKSGSSNALINSTDMFLSIMELADIDPSETVPAEIALDSVSFVPYLRDTSTASIRQYAYADVFGGSFAGVGQADYTVRNETFKLLRRNNQFELYHLADDPFEKVNLLEEELTIPEKEQYDALRNLASELRSGK